MTPDSSNTTLADQALQASRSGDTAQAIQLFEIAIRADPGNPLLHYLLAAEHAQLGQMLDAEAGFARAVLLGPALHMARFQLGLLQYTERRVAVAMLTWQPLGNLPPSEPLQRFVMAFAALARDDFDGARALLNEGIAANTDIAPLNVDMRMVLARIDEVQGRSTDAAQSVDSTDDASHVLLSNYRAQGPSN